MRNLPALMRTSFIPTLLVKSLPPSLSDRSTSTSGASDEPERPGSRATATSRAAVRPARRNHLDGDTAGFPHGERDGIVPTSPAFIIASRRGRVQRSIPPQHAHDAEAFRRGAGFGPGVPPEGRPA